MKIFGSLIWDAHPGHAPEGYLVICNVGHSGSLINIHYLESTRCCYKIRNINVLNIMAWISDLNISPKNVTLQKQQKVGGVSRIAQNLVIHKFNAS